MKPGKVYRILEGHIVPLAYNRKLEAFRCVVVEGKRAGCILYIPKVLIEQSIVGAEEVQNVRFIHQKQLQKILPQ